MAHEMSQATIDQIAADIRNFGTTLSGLQDQTKRELTEMRSVIDATAKQADVVAQDRIEKFAASIETKVTAIETGLKETSTAVEKVEAVLNRPGGGGWAGAEAAQAAKEAFAWHKAVIAASGKLTTHTDIQVDAEAYQEYCAKAFPAYIRARSDAALRPQIQASLNTASDPDGGYHVPTTMSSRIITKIYETSAMRDMATVESIAGKELTIPRDEGEAGAGGWVGEFTAPSETTTPQWGESKLTAYEMFVEPRVTQTMLEDAGLDTEGWLSRKVGEKMGRIEATAFFAGTGVNQPRGIMTYPHGTTNGTIEQVNSGAATAITSDGIYNLVFQLKDFYLTNARFVMKRLTVRDVLKLKNGDGDYMWQMGDIRQGIPQTLLGYPITRAEDMDTIAASSLSVLFGDVRAAYTIVDRLGLTLLRDNLTAKPYIKYYTRRRVGGDVVNFEAVKILKTSA